MEDQPNEVAKVHTDQEQAGHLLHAQGDGRQGHQTPHRNVRSHRGYGQIKQSYLRYLY